MRTFGLAVAALAALALIAAVVALVVLGGGEDPEKIALRVAEEWAKDSVDRVADQLGDLVTGETPVLRDVAALVIRNQIRENVTWSYAKPTREGEGRYRVVTTAAAPFSVSVLIVRKSYRLSADFVLTVDTEREQVEDWRLDIGSFRL